MVASPPLPDPSPGQSRCRSRAGQRQSAADRSCIWTAGGAMRSLGLIGTGPHPSLEIPLGLWSAHISVFVGCAWNTEIRGERRWRVWASRIRSRL